MARWLRFRTYVGNRISTIVDLLPPDKWRHVNVLDNPADCASERAIPFRTPRALTMVERSIMVEKSPADWPKRLPLPPNDREIEIKEVSRKQVSTPTVIPIDQTSNFTRLKRTTAGIIRFVTTVKKGLHVDPLLQSNLYLLSQLKNCSHYWLKHIQNTHFSTEMAAIENKEIVHSLKSLNPFVDQSSKLLRVDMVVDIDSLTYPTDLATLSFYMANIP